LESVVPHFLGLAFYPEAYEVADSNKLKRDLEATNRSKGKVPTPRMTLGKTHGFLCRSGVEEYDRLLAESPLTSKPRIHGLVLVQKLGSILFFSLVPRRLRPGIALARAGC